MHTTYLGLGTNLGDKRENIAEAVRRIRESIGEVLRQSTLYETEPWGFVSANTFVNTAVCVETQLSPHELLKATQEIERAMGRTEKSNGGEYHDRIIDIDILLYDDIHLSDDSLTIPHPLMHERDFVMNPLNEIMHA